MQAYKVKAKIDPAGHLIITEPIDLPVGDVEVIIWQEVENLDIATDATTNSSSVGNQSKLEYQSKFMREWSANNHPVSPDFDPEQARLEALQEKYL
ncbi:hypothetical protein [Argonema antarcticum]|uniref:hypothetical protein n=1 Tax=Argonema antarcticum TaxID=2942763 RepID=UPI0020125507|nr:hypothetical protein [Argonema antarcticum]MCL1469204.1 hypothetical protein [Argonema antarcticum A004/B2]